MPEGPTYKQPPKNVTEAEKNIIVENIAVVSNQERQISDPATQKQAEAFRIEINGKLIEITHDELKNLIEKIKNCRSEQEVRKVLEEFFEAKGISRKEAKEIIEKLAPVLYENRDKPEKVQEAVQREVAKKQLEKEEEGQKKWIIGLPLDAKTKSRLLECYEKGDWECIAKILHSNKEKLKEHGITEQDINKFVESCKLHFQARKAFNQGDYNTAISLSHEANQILNDLIIGEAQQTMMDVMNQIRDNVLRLQERMVEGDKEMSEDLGEVIEASERFLTALEKIEESKSEAAAGEEENGKHSVFPHYKPTHGRMGDFTLLDQ